MTVQKKSNDAACVRGTYRPIGVRVPDEKFTFRDRYERRLTTTVCARESMYFCKVFKQSSNREDTPGELRTVLHRPEPEKSALYNHADTRADD